MSILYIWPGQWGLPSIDPPSLAAALYLTHTIPGQFSISYCTNPDLSPSGTLPFLRTQEGKAVAPLSSIIKHVSGVQGAENIDAGLTAFETSQKRAWCSHIETNLGDLVSYVLYSLPENWTKLIHPTLAYALPIPQRYYVPGRIRNLRRPRLESAGLWNDQAVEPKRLLPKSTSEHKEKIAQTFQREKVLQTARDCLDIYQRLLGGKHFILHHQVTTLDIMLAAHVLVILKPPFPDKFLSELLMESYPTLVSHADRILIEFLESPVPVGSPPDYSIWSLLPLLPHDGRERAEKSQEEIDSERTNWGWIGLALGSIGLYLATMGNPLRVVE